MYWFGFNTLFLPAPRPTAYPSQLTPQFPPHVNPPKSRKACQKMACFNFPM